MECLTGLDYKINITLSMLGLSSVCLFIVFSGKKLKQNYKNSIFFRSEATAFVMSACGV